MRRPDLDTPRDLAARRSLDPTRARPEPWFVGNGPRLRNVILIVLGLVLVLRGVTSVWMAEQGWSLWTEWREFLRERGASGQRGAPPDDARLAGAKLQGDPTTFYSADDYPPEAQRRGEQGRAVARLTVDRTGAVVRCAITSSSGSPRLDQATCRIALKKARYTPARDILGAPTAATTTLPVRWVLPDEPDATQRREDGRFTTAGRAPMSPPR